MNDDKAVRIDKFLWSVRLYKTRSIASEECRKGRIIINSIQVKPSRPVNSGEVITVRKPPVSHTYRVIEPVDNRVSAKLVSQFLEDLTPESEKIKLELHQTGNKILRARGTGRPTKKERRLLDRMHHDPDQ